MISFRLFETSPLPPSLVTPRTTTAAAPVLLISLASVLLLMTWDHSSLDLWMAHWFGSVSGFPLENHWFWAGVLHKRIRLLPWLVELALLTAIVRPFGALRQLPIERRTQLALTTLLALIVVSSIKRHSLTSCPWDLHEFGGTATYVSHWAWSMTDGGSGGCFPAGHASAGFAFMGGFFAFRHEQSKTAQRWLAAALMAGLVLGLAQQVRGAHYMSHTLWTAWLCWTVAALVDSTVSQMLSQTPLRAQAQAPGLLAMKPSLQAAGKMAFTGLRQPCRSSACWCHRVRPWARRR